MASHPRRIVIALGGNAISSADHRGDIGEQFAASRETARHIADVIAAGHHILLVHGNGPQVGATLRRVELSRHEVYPIPLALCVANTQAGMGFMICECIRNEMLGRGVRGRDVRACTIITTVRVNPDDEAFDNPSKPVGQDYDEATAKARAQSDGWAVAEISPGRWRRVVASPTPRRIEEGELIRHLFDEGRVVVCGGGGGIPIVLSEEGRSHSVEAVVDKDLTASLLAVETGADALVILTNVEHVLLDRGTDRERAVRELTITDARRHLEEGQFGMGSMAPKVRACVEFLEETDRPEALALITRTDRVMAGLAGEMGTRVVSG